MPRFVARLSPALVNNAKKGKATPGMHAMAAVSIFTLTRGAPRRRSFATCGTAAPAKWGSARSQTIGLADARERATTRRRELLDGIDPLRVREQQRHRAKLDAANAMTFEQCAQRYIMAHKATWKSPKSLAAWEGTLKSDVHPVFGKLPVQAVDVALVMKAIEPIWTTKPETASRIRGRIESILDYAAAHGWRHGENPARWRGHLDKLLPAPAKAKQAVRRTTGRDEHHPALPYGEIAVFLAEPRQQQGTAARALEFAILTAARTGEVIGARWDEFHLSEKLWIVPAERMKGSREHRVPLSDAALAIVKALAENRQGDFVFPGGTKGRPLSNMAMLVLLRRMKRSDLTIHGFRSTFRDWAAERTNFPAEVAEMALAHAVGDKVEAAYRRGDLFQKRQQLMDAWAKFCAAPTPTSAVVPLRRQS